MLEMEEDFRVVREVGDGLKVAALVARLIDAVRAMPHAPDITP